MFKKILIGVGIAVLALLALGASDCETETDTATDPAATATEAPAIEPTEEESQLEAEIEYLTASGLLIAEHAEISDDFAVWSEDVGFEYGLGILYPDTTGGESVLDRMRDVARRGESLNVPPVFQEASGFWVASAFETITGMELVIAGVEQFDVDLIDQGAAHIVEATRLVEESGAALERVTLSQ